MKSIQRERESERVECRRGSVGCSTSVAAASHISYTILQKRDTAQPHATNKVSLEAGVRVFGCTLLVQPLAAAAAHNHKMGFSPFCGDFFGVVVAVGIIKMFNARVQPASQPASHKY